MTTYNVLDFGADPTDSSDDSGAIQSAIDAASAGDTVLVPAVDNPGSDYYTLDPGGSGGTCLSFGTDDNGVTLRGEGYDSHLRLVGGLSSNTYAVRLDAGSGTLTDIHVEQLRLDGNRTNNGGISNSWGVIVFESDASSPDDSGLEVNGVWTHDFKTCGIQLARATTAYRCTSYANSGHGMATTYGRYMASGEINTVDHCYTHDNGGYGVDLHGKGTVQYHRGVNDNYGFKSSSDWDARDSGRDHVHHVRFSKFEGSNVFGDQLTNHIQEMHMEDVWVDSPGGWGFRFAQAGDFYIQGNGLKVTNAGRSRSGEGGVRIGGDDVNMVSGSSTSTIRVDGTNGNEAVAIRSTSSGTVDRLLYRNVGTPVQDSGGASVSSVTSASDVGDVTVPAMSEVGAEAYGGGTSSSSGSTSEPAPDPAPKMALVTAGGYPVATGGHARAAGASGATASSAGTTTIADFENVANLSDTFDYGTRGFLSTDANYESGGSHSLAVGGSTGGFEEMVATPAAADPLPAFFGKGEVARFYLRASADTGYSGAIFAAADDANFYSANLFWDSNGVRIYKKEAGSYTVLHDDQYLTGIGDANRWYEVRVVRDDGSLGGADDDVTVEIRDPTTDPSQVLWSYTFNDATHAGNVGIGMQTNNFDAAGEFAYLDNVVKE